MFTYTLYWCDGTIEIIKGKTFGDALYKNGYTSTALPAIEYVKTEKETL